MTAPDQSASDSKRPLRFLFVSEEALIGDLALAVKLEGHEVKYFIKSKNERDVADGFLQKVDSVSEHVDWADCIVFDDVGFGDQAEKFRKEGKAVVGGTKYADKLEDDRDFGQEEMKAAGLTTLANWDFKSFDDALDFLKANPARYVVKPSGQAQNEKELLYVGQDEDGRDVHQILNLYKDSWGSKIKRFQLQKYVSGVEVAVGAFFNGQEFITPININFEHKRLFPGEVGPSTGEMGCYDEETEVLTSEGWTHFSKLTYDNEICTLNPATRRVVFDRPSAIVEFEHHQELIRATNGAVDVAVTPDHNMVVEVGGMLRFGKAASLRTGALIPGSGIVPADGRARSILDRLGESLGETTLVRPREFWRERYKGKVYCATVPSHVMLVRREAEPYWCGNTHMLWSPRNSVFDETLGKMQERLAKSGYVGYIDINNIANARGIYPLEFTSRFGYPTISIQMEGVISRWGEFLHGIAKGEKPELKVKKGFQLGVVVACPPFPFTDPGAFKKYSEDAPVLFKKNDNGPLPSGIHIGDVKLVDGVLRLAGESGYALVVTGSSITMEDAREQAFRRVQNIVIPNMFYRTDIGMRWYLDSDKLHSWGYLYGQT